MDAADLERVYEAFEDFHAYFAPVFGRKESWEHSRHYLQGLLVQSQERRNAENLAETVPASARVLPRFLTASPWDDEGVIGRLQEYLGSRLADPQAVWVLDGSDFPKQGVKSVGVIRQYCRLDFTQNLQQALGDPALERHRMWQVSEGFSLSASDSRLCTKPRQIIRTG